MFSDQNWGLQLNAQQKWKYNKLILTCYERQERVCWIPVICFPLSLPVVPKQRSCDYLQFSDVAIAWALKETIVETYQV